MPRDRAPTRASLRPSLLPTTPLSTILPSVQPQRRLLVARRTIVPFRSHWPQPRASRTRQLTFLRLLPASEIVPAHAPASICQLSLPVRGLLTIRLQAMQWTPFSSKQQRRLHERRMPLDQQPPCYKQSCNLQVLAAPRQLVLSALAASMCAGPNKQPHRPVRTKIMATLCHLHLLAHRQMDHAPRVSAGLRTWIETVFQNQTPYLW